MDFDYREEQKNLKKQVRKFAEEKLQSLAEKVDEMDDIFWPLVKLMAEEGLFRYALPKKFGGTDAKAINLCIIREELSRICVQADDLFAMTFLASYPIATFGTEEQKGKYLPHLATGKVLGSFSLTEPDAGSDASGIKTIATLKGDDYVLNGTKCFASNAADAEVCVMFAKTDPSLGSKGISAFIVDTKTKQKGINLEKIKLTGPHSLALIKLDNYHIPRNSLLGQPGKGMKIALTTLDMARPTVGGAAVGLAQGAYEEALAYTHRRFVFNQSLAEFQLIQWKLADMVTSIQAARLLVARAASVADSGAGEHGIGWASMAKLFATEMASRVADEAVQIHGGSGLVRGCRIDRIYRSVRAPRIYEGTSEIQRLTIARAIYKGDLDQ